MAVIIPLVCILKVMRLYDDVRLMAIRNGESISPYYGCRGCSQHIEFAKKYAPHFRKKMLILEIGAALSFFIPLGFMILLINRQ